MGPAAQNPPLPDTGNVLLGKYRMGRLLGHGSFAKVNEARSLETGIAVAIKQIDKKKTADAGVQESMILGEIAVMRRLKHHPNIIEIHEVMATKSKIFIVIELASGGDLFSHLIRRGEKLPETMAVGYFKQLVSALRLCHASGVAHRDIKLHNILLDRDGNVKLSDFGLSALPDRLGDDGLLHTACGTPAFTAPEVFERRGYDGAKADAWSCGVILFALLTGFLPFDDENLALMYLKIRRRDLRFPKWMPKATRLIIYKLLDPNWETRISLEEVMQTRWFKKHQKNQNENEMDASKSPRSLGKVVDSVSANAFDIISLSSGLDLSGLFEVKRRRGKRFMAAVPVAELIGKTEEVGAKLGYRVVENREGAAAGLRKEEVLIVVEAVEVPAAAAAATVAQVRVMEGEVGDEEWEELKKGLHEVVSSWHHDI